MHSQNLMKVERLHNEILVYYIYLIIFVLFLIWIWFEALRRYIHLNDIIGAALKFSSSWVLAGMFEYYIYL